MCLCARDASWQPKLRIRNLDALVLLMQNSKKNLVQRRRWNRRFVWSSCETREITQIKVNEKDMAFSCSSWLWWRAHASAFVAPTLDYFICTCKLKLNRRSDAFKMITCNGWRRRALAWESHISQSYQMLWHLNADDAAIDSTLCIERRS